MLSKQAMQHVKVGQRLRFSDGVAGTVTNVNKCAIGVDWEAGQSGDISVEDGQQLALEETEELEARA